MFKLALTLLWPTLLFAGFQKTPQSQCSDIDLRNPVLGDARDQQDVAWCYAFTGADMLGYAFDLPEKVSAADVAIGYNATKVGRLVRWLDVNVINRKDEERRRMTHTTGFNKISLDKAMQAGWCPEEIFPSESWVKRTRVGSSWTTQTVPLKEAMIDISKLHEKRTTLTVDNLPHYFAFKNIDTPEKFLSLLNTKHIRHFYDSLRLNACKDDRIPYDRHWKVKMVFKNPRIFSRLNEQLNVGRLVGLDYDGTILEDRNYRRMKLGQLHTSSIVARRWNSATNSCQFLIRDSYGTTCDNRYDQSYDCEAGHVWIDEGIIYPAMTSIVYMLHGIK